MIMQSIATQLKDYRPDANPFRAVSHWHRDSQIDVYLRTGQYYYLPETGRQHFVVGVSNVVVDPEHRQQGVFRSFMAELECAARKLGYEYLLAEQVGEPILQAWLDRAGFVCDCNFPAPVYSKRLKP